MERVPRYTSYPTAPQFHEGINREKYATWLDLLTKESTLSLYIHIPFCKKLCSFCGCHTKIVNHYTPVQGYLELLEREIDLISNYTKGRTVVKHIHFGGGSPTILTAKDFTHFMATLHQSFNISKDAEIAIEMDPRTLDTDKIKAFKKAGITRASLGVQDFNPKVQLAINRIQPYEMVQETVNKLRTHGINSFNIDLIYGLPHQTLEIIQKTIEQTVSLEPNRISLFGYAHVPWMKKHQRLIPEETLPGKEDRIAMFKLAKTLLLQAGYVYIGLDHFTKPDDSMAIAAETGNLQRNFQGYTTDRADALIGLGISSISSLPQGYVQNTTRYTDYVHSIEASQLPVARGIEFTSEDIDRQRIIMSLMCYMQAEVSQLHYAKELDTLKSYAESGSISYKNGVLKIKEGGRNKLRLIASTFDSYLQDTTHLYSQAE